MNLLKNIDFMDFYFNGHWLSEFGGIVGGTEPLKQYPLLPTRSYVTDRAANQDGQYVFGSYLEPRIFEVPVFFENIDDAGLRNIAAWLNSKEASWFYYKNDTLKIKCMIDGEYLLDTISGENGQVYLKFIAHDPFYYEIDQTVTELKNTSNASVFSSTITNLGNQVSYPSIKVYGTGDIVIQTIIPDGADEIVYSECTVTDVIAATTVDSLYCNCLSASGANWFSHFDGTFPVFPPGTFILRISGNTTKVEVTPNYRWV